MLPSTRTGRSLRFFPSKIMIHHMLHVFFTSRLRMCKPGGHLDVTREKSEVEMGFKRNGILAFVVFDGSLCTGFKNGTWCNCRVIEYNNTTITVSITINAFFDYFSGEKIC